MNYTESIEYIHSINWCFCKPGLERTKHLCNMLGDPQNELKFIHVAGTNGKGSFCSMLDAILRRAGYKTGMFTSPYIRFFNERICFDGKPISDDELAEVTSFVRPFADSMGEKPTEFELITAIGFEYFRRKGCDVVILETGMGGRLDSTNIIEAPLISVITGIALDHTAYLGDTVRKIAYEKAGIIKRGSPALFGGCDEDALEVIRTYADEVGAPLHVTDRESIRNIRADLLGTMFDFEELKDIELGTLGLYQPYNAANVKTAVDILNATGAMSIPTEAIYDGFREARWPARFELIGKDPTVIYDGAHNPEGIAAAVKSIKAYFPDKKIFVLSGVMKDKDYNCIAKDLSTVASRAFTVTPDNPRALDARDYAGVLSSHGIDATPFDTLGEGLDTALKAARSTNTPLICLGSLYMYSELMGIYEKMK